MQQLLSVWSALDSRKRVIVALASVAMFAAVLALSRMATAPSMALLYAGLSSNVAGEVVQALEQRGVVYEVRGGAIYVDQSRRDELRMTLASEGLPANSTAGYELLDSLSGFGTTAQMFDAAYWRAKEGELARTIVSSPEIKTARVHIANPSSQPFRRQIRPTASVTVTTRSGNLSSTQAKALKYLVASAVAGLVPEDVSVIDARGGLIQGEDTATGAPVANDLAAEMKMRVQRLLEAHVGRGNAVVEVSVETETERETISERSFDPESRVAISTETEERSRSSNNSGGGAAVTVASNLPSGEAGGNGGGNSRSQNSETRERINYEVSETRREILRQPGAIKRLSVAVLVADIRETDDAGAETIRPRNAEELDALRELVASAVGFQEERGDIITLKSMAFSPIAVSGTPAAISIFERLGISVMSLIQLSVLSIVALVLGLFVVRPILKSASSAAALPAPDQGAAGAVVNTPTSNTEDALPPLTGEISDGGILPANMAVVSDLDLPGSESGNLASGLEPLGNLSRPEDPVSRLRQMIEERQEETVEILRSWMDESQEKA